jgi:hypothetical protein
MTSYFMVGINFIFILLNICIEDRAKIGRAAKHHVTKVCGDCR